MNPQKLFILLWRVIFREFMQKQVTINKLYDELKSIKKDVEKMKTSLIAISKEQKFPQLRASHQMLKEVWKNEDDKLWESYL